MAELKPRSLEDKAHGITEVSSPAASVQDGAALSDDTNMIETNGKEEEKEKEEGVIDRSYMQDYRFWAILLALCSTSLLASLENTVIVTSLPTIVEALNFGSSYVWVGNIFFLTSAAVQPFFGQVANLFGRRYLTIFIVAIYTLGSGICGGANGPAMLIAGRAIQGAGSGGLNMIIEVIISDLVPLRDRGYFMAIMLVMYGVGVAAGPAVGGVIVENTSWRWVFYINLPVGGVALVLLWAFLRVKWDRTESVRERLSRLDYVGNLVLVASTVSILLALTWAGVVHPWSSFRVLVPLVLGLAGLVLFAWYEGSAWVNEPVLPLRLFKNRTSAAVYVATLLNSTMVYWIFFYVPLYFQGVLLSSPARSGVQILPMCLISIPGAAVSAVVLSRWGKYRALHLAGFALETVGLGLFSLLGVNSHSTWAWVTVQILPALGSGMLLNTQLPAFQAAVGEKDQAAATAGWAFARSFGWVWGSAFPAAIFNAYTARYVQQRIEDAGVVAALSTGNSYASATRAFVTQFEGELRDQIRGVFSSSLRMVYLFGIIVTGLGFLLGLLERDIPLRTELETEYGLEERKKASVEGDDDKAEQSNRGSE